MDGVYRESFQLDDAATWLATNCIMPVVGLVNIDELDNNIAKLFCMPTWEADFEEACQIISTDAFILGQALTNSATGTLQSLPHQSCSHVLVTDEPVLLEQRLAGTITSIQIMMNGSEDALELFTKNIQNERRVIIVPFTGGAADLAVSLFIFLMHMTLSIYLFIYLS